MNWFLAERGRLAFGRTIHRVNGPERTALYVRSIAGMYRDRPEGVNHMPGQLASPTHNPPPSSPGPFLVSPAVRTRNFVPCSETTPLRCVRMDRRHRRPEPSPMTPSESSTSRMERRERLKDVFRSCNRQLATQTPLQTCVSSPAATSTIQTSSPGALSTSGAKVGKEAQSDPVPPLSIVVGPRLMQATSGQDWYAQHGYDPSPRQPAFR